MTIDTDLAAVFGKVGGADAVDDMEDAETYLLTALFEAFVGFRPPAVIERNPNLSPQLLSFLAERCRPLCQRGIDPTYGGLRHVMTEDGVQLGPGWRETIRRRAETVIQFNPGIGGFATIRHQVEQQLSAPNGQGPDPVRNLVITDDPLTACFHRVALRALLFGLFGEMLGTHAQLSEWTAAGRLAVSEGDLADRAERAATQRPGSADVVTWTEPALVRYTSRDAGRIIASAHELLRPGGGLALAAPLGRAAPTDLEYVDLLELAVRPGLFNGAAGRSHVDAAHQRNPLLPAFLFIVKEPSQQ